MKGLRIVFAVVALGLMLGAGVAQAQYISIQHNLLNGSPDTSYDPNTGVFRVYADANAGGTNLVTLNDNPPLVGGTITNTVIDLQTTFNQIVGNQAQFAGGSLTLTFNYNGVPRQISGPITGMLFDPPSQIGPNWKIDGQGRWKATTVNLPGSGMWPDGGGFSSIDSITLVFNQNLAGFNWETQALQGNVQTQYSLFPNDSAVPEPASLVLLALGGLVVLRRRG